MKNWGRAQWAGVTLILVLLPLVCGVVFLANNAPRTWSLHWVAPRTEIQNTAATAYVTTATRNGWEVLWSRPSGSMVLSRFDRVGQSTGPDTPIAGNPASLALARAGNMDVAVWRQDYNGGSKLLAATILPGHKPVYRVLASGVWSLEHPQAFAVGSGVDVIFAWQRPAFNVYLVRISATGAVSSPRALTHVSGYAFDPRAVLTPQGTVQLLYFNQCCSPPTFHLEDAFYSSQGQPLGKPRVLDTVASILEQNQGTVPNNWGLDVIRSGPQVWAAWSSDAGIQVASWRDNRLFFDSVAVPGPPPASLALAVAGSQRELVWERMSNSNVILETVPLGPDGSPTSAPDRVAYESGIAGLPQGIPGQQPATVLWQSSPGASGARIEESHFSPSPISAPSLWARFGLGVADPIGNMFLLLFGAVALGVLLTVGNVLVVFALLLIYLISARTVGGRWKWVAYTVGLVIVLYLLLVQAGAPFPPVIAFSQLAVGPGTLAIVAMGVFVLVSSFTVLRRVDDVYRAALMAFTGFFFLAFLDALVLIQGQLGQV